MCLIPSLVVLLSYTSVCKIVKISLRQRTKHSLVQSDSETIDVICLYVSKGFHLGLSLCDKELPKC